MSTTPPAILEADRVSMRHRNHEPLGGAWVWRLKLGDKVFIRFNGSFMRRSKNGANTIAWCRIDDNARHRTSRPAPATFLRILQEAIRTHP